MNRDDHRKPHEIPENAMNEEQIDIHGSQNADEPGPEGAAARLARCWAVQFRPRRRTGLSWPFKSSWPGAKR